MSLTTFGDAARFATFGQDAGRLKTELQRLSTELSSGRRSDPGALTGGDHSALADIRRGLRLTEAFAEGLAAAALVAGGRQSALERLATEIEGLGPSLLSVAGPERSAELDIRLADAPDRFAQAVTVLNTRVAGQSIFAGDTPDRPALADVGTILGALRPLATGAPDAASALAAIDAWFQDAGGGFETVAWLGGTGAPTAVYLGEGRTIDAGVTALDPGLRTVLSGLAIAALASEGRVPPVPDARSDFATAAAVRMMTGEAQLIDLRAGVGVAEDRIETARTASEATRAALRLEEARLVASDPYEAATEIEAVSRQLESLFLLTARLSNLTLTEFLR